MAAEFLRNDVQTVAPGAPVLLNTRLGCPRGNVYHRPESGILTLKGAVNNPNAAFATYQVTFNANIALSTGATVGPIAVALAIDGEPILTSRAIVTPAAVGNYFNVTSTAIIQVPRGCCFNVSVENVSEAATALGTPPTIDVQNANLVVTRIS